MVHSNRAPLYILKSLLHRKQSGNKQRISNKFTKFRFDILVPEDVSSEKQISDVLTSVSFVTPHFLLSIKTVFDDFENVFSLGDLIFKHLLNNSTLFFGDDISSKK